MRKRRVPIIRPQTILGDVAHDDRGFAIGGGPTRSVLRPNPYPVDGVGICLWQSDCSTVKELAAFLVGQKDRTGRPVADERPNRTHQLIHDQIQRLFLKGQFQQLVLQGLQVPGLLCIGLFGLRVEDCAKNGA